MSRTSSVDQWTSSLKLLDEMSKAMILLVVKLLDAAFRYNAAVVGIHDEFIFGAAASGFRLRRHFDGSEGRKGADGSEAIDQTRA